MVDLPGRALSVVFDPQRFDRPLDLQTHFVGFRTGDMLIAEGLLTRQPQLDSGLLRKKLPPVRQNEVHQRCARTQLLGPSKKAAQGFGYGSGDQLDIHIDTPTIRDAGLIEGRYHVVKQMLGIGSAKDQRFQVAANVFHHSFAQQFKTKNRTIVRKNPVSVSEGMRVQVIHFSDCRAANVDDEGVGFQTSTDPIKLFIVGCALF